MKISDTFDSPEAEVTEGFMLSLRDHQLRTMSWMKSIESLELNDSTTIVNNILEDDPECRLKLKVGDTPYYLGIPNPSSDIYSPKITELEPLRIFGGILADDTGSGKTVTTIPARRLKKEKKNMKNDSYLMACMCHHVLIVLFVRQIFMDNGLRKPKSATQISKLSASLGWLNIKNIP